MGLLHFFNILGTSKEIAGPISYQDPEKPSVRPSKVTPHQRVLLLRGPREPYVEVSDHPTPSLDGNREFLVRNLVIGLNPIDWKAP